MIQFNSVVRIIKMLKKYLISLEFIKNSVISGKWNIKTFVLHLKVWRLKMHLLIKKLQKELAAIEVLLLKEWQLVNYI